MFFLCSVNFAIAIAIDKFDYKKHLKHVEKSVNEHPQLKAPRNYRVSTLAKREGKMLKKGNKIDFIHIKGLVRKYSKTETTKFYRSKRAKKFFKRLLKKLSGPIRFEEVDNGVSNIIKLKVFDTKDKYSVVKVSYKLNSIKTKRQTQDTYREDESTYVDIDISSIELGKFKLFFAFEAIKDSKKHKNKRFGKYKKNKSKIYLGMGEFEKTQSAFAKLSIIQEKPTDSFATISAEESYSESSEIEKYTYNLYRDGSLVDTVESDEQSIFYRFRDIGTFDIEVVVTDLNGNLATSEKQSIRITNSSPTLAYTYAPNPDFPGTYSIDFTGAHDKDASIEMTHKLIDTRYCLKSKLTDEDADLFEREVKANTYNTKKRLMA